MIAKNTSCTSSPIVLITRLDGGGMETFCLNLLSEWVTQGRTATLYVSHGGGKSEDCVPSGIEKVCWNVRARKSFFRLAKWLRSRASDPCIALSQELAVVLALLKTMRIIPNRIYYRESTDVARHYGWKFRMLMRWLWPKFDGLIEQSGVGITATRKICKTSLPPCLLVRNIMQLPSCGVNVADGSGRNNRYMLACVGSFKAMKGQRYLIEELAKELLEDWHLTFWGDGETRHEIEELVNDVSLERRVTFRDWERDKSAIYRPCDVVIVPSDYEGLPNVMLEAILYGKRVSVRPTCIGACELLNELGVGETWPWRKSIEIPDAVWNVARKRLAKICDPKKVGVDIWDFISV